MAHACSSVFCPEEYVVFLKESSVIHQHLRAGLFTDVWEALGRLVVAGWRADPWKARRCPAGARRGRAPRRKFVCRADLADGGPGAQGPRVGVVWAGGWWDRATLNKTDSSPPVRWLPCGQVTLTAHGDHAPRDLPLALRPDFSGEWSHRGLSPPSPALPLPSPPAAMGCACVPHR